ncbi:sensor histidine kinase [Nocardiopsis protaetiae]|uniref:sensor histidine kinase n=1 Tax=Nocardiopsis protaetiae TaxID=3382270 RepID=UPI00387AAD76
MNSGNGSPERPRWRTRAADAALAAVLAAAIAFQAYNVASTWGGGHWWPGAAAGAAVAVIALVRRRGRAVAAVAGLCVAAAAVPVSWWFGLPAEPGPAAALPLAVLTASAVRHLPVRAACAVAAGGLAVVGTAALPELGSSSGMPVVWLNLVLWLGGVAAGLGPRLLAGHRRRTADRVRRDERLEVARELHDVVAHHITGLVIEAQAGRIEAPAGSDGDRARASFTAIEAEGAEALAAMRRVVGLLREHDGAAPTSPAAERLTDLVERFDRRGGPPAHLHLADDEQTWPPEVAGAVYRVVQESLTNIARHAAHADTVTVRVAREGGGLTVEVTDDAPGPAHRRRPGGYGLVGMGERVRALGGTLEAGPRPEGGWSVVAALPLPDRRSR